VQGWDAAEGYPENLSRTFNSFWNESDNLRRGGHERVPVWRAWCSCASTRLTAF